jgi:hypothetical protein
MDDQNFLDVIINYRGREYTQICHISHHEFPMEFNFDLCTHTNGFQNNRHSNQ